MRALPLLALVLSLPACSHFALAPASGGPEIDPARDVELGRFTGYSRALVIFPGIPLGWPTVEDAMDDAMHRGGGNAIDGIFGATQRTYIWAVIFAVEGYEVTGTVWRVEGPE